MLCRTIISSKYFEIALQNSTLKEREREKKKKKENVREYESECLNKFEKHQDFDAENE